MLKPARSKTVRLDPVAILREEAIAAALAHGADRCSDLADDLVRRYVARIGGFNAYVRMPRPDLMGEVDRLHNGDNTQEVARVLHITPRHVQRLVQRLKARKVVACARSSE